MSSGLEDLEGTGGGLRFTDNFVRLLGMHALSQNFAASLLGISGATVSSWMNGKSSPSLQKAITIAELFQVSTDRLMGAEFADLLTTELADRERYERVEERIRRSRSSLHSL
jgi:transcriptional regulator with XRE-family HTH domain